MQDYRNIIRRLNYYQDFKYNARVYYLDNIAIKIKHPHRMKRGLT